MESIPCSQQARFQGAPLIHTHYLPYALSAITVSASVCGSQREESARASEHTGYTIHLNSGHYLPLLYCNGIGVYVTQRRKCSGLEHSGYTTHLYSGALSNSCLMSSSHLEDDVTSCTNTGTSTWQIRQCLGLVRCSSGMSNAMQAHRKHYRQYRHTTGTLKEPQEQAH